MDSKLVITHLTPLPSVAKRRALRGQPLPTDTGLRVSGLRWDRENGYHVAIIGDGRAAFCAQLALSHVAHDWLDCHGLDARIERLTGPDYRESAEKARAYYESYVYDPACDPENVDCDVILNDKNEWWYGGE